MSTHVSASNLGLRYQTHYSLSNEHSSHSQKDVTVTIVTETIVLHLQVSHVCTHFKSRTYQLMQEAPVQSCSSADVSDQQGNDNRDTSVQPS